MATFLLIHGSFVGGWIWQPTARSLRKQGHIVYARSADGCAERKNGLRAGLSVANAAQELADLIFYEDLANVTLVATSTGGMIAQALAPMVREQLGRIVLLDTLMPMPGESIKDIVRRPDAPPYQMTEFTRGPTREDMENGFVRGTVRRGEDMGAGSRHTAPAGPVGRAAGRNGRILETVLECDSHPLRDKPESTGVPSAPHGGKHWAPTTLKSTRATTQCSPIRATRRNCCRPKRSVEGNAVKK